MRSASAQQHITLVLRTSKIFETSNSLNIKHEPSGVHVMHFFVIPPLEFYMTLRVISQKTTLEEAETTVYALPDSDIEDEDDVRVEEIKVNWDDEVPLAVLVGKSADKHNQNERNFNKNGTHVS